MLRGRILELFLARYETFVHPVFDTQMAASFLGFGDMVSYGGLVEGLLNLKLDKESQSSDWLVRPLEESQKQYALGDVSYLWFCYQEIKKRIEQLGRQDWVAEAMLPFADKTAFCPNVEKAYLKVKGRFKGKEGCLRGLAAWREKEAIRQDRPRRRVVSDEVLLQLAHLGPKVAEKSSSLSPPIKIFLEKVPKQSEFWDILQSPPPKEATPFSIPKAISSHKQSLARAILKSQSQVTQIAEQRLCLSSELDAFLRASPSERESFPLMKGWRRGLIGLPLASVLSGQAMVSFDEERDTLIIDVKEATR